MRPLMAGKRSIFVININLLKKIGQEMWRKYQDRKNWEQLKFYAFPPERAEQIKQIKCVKVENLLH